MSSFRGNWSPLLVQCFERFSEELGIFSLDRINEPTRLFCDHLVWTRWPTCQHSVLGSLLILILGTGWNLEISFYSLSWLEVELWSSYILEVFRAAFCDGSLRILILKMKFFFLVSLSSSWLEIELWSSCPVIVNILTPYSPFLFNKTPSVWNWVAL